MTTPPTCTSIQEHVSRLGDVGFWWSYVAEILERHGLVDATLPALLPLQDIRTLDELATEPFAVQATSAPDTYPRWGSHLFKSTAKSGILMHLRPDLHPARLRPVGATTPPPRS